MSAQLNTVSSKLPCGQCNQQLASSHSQQRWLTLSPHLRLLLGLCHNTEQVLQRLCDSRLRLPLPCTHKGADQDACATSRGRSRRWLGQHGWEPARDRKSNRHRHPAPINLEQHLPRRKLQRKLHVTHLQLP